MKTDIRRIYDELYAEVKQLTARTDRTLSATIEESLRAMLARRRAMERSPFNLATFRGTGLFKGVHLDRSEELLVLLETPHKRNEQ